MQTASSRSRLSGSNEPPVLLPTIAARLQSVFRDHSGEDRAAFYLAVLAALTARLKMTAHVTLGFSGKRLQLVVETGSRFQELLIQVRRAMDQEATNDAACDAVLEMEGDPDTSAAGGPTYAVREIPESDTAIVTYREVGAVEATSGKLEALACLLEHASAQSDEIVGRLRLIRDEDARALYAQLNRTETMLPSDTVLDFVAAAAASHAAKDAVVYADRATTYEQLASRSDAIARQLRRRGADQKRPVAICMERSECVPLMQLAVLKAGSFYVQLDPGHPSQRLVDMVEECRPAVVIASANTATLFAGMSVALCNPAELEADAEDDAQLPVVVASDLAYMIYTSGTTGRPKGVMVRHGSLVNLLLGAGELMTETSRLLAVASFAFDISVLDMYLPLIHGATVVIAPDSAVGDPWRLMKLMEEQAIDFLQATPVTWRMLVAAGFVGGPNMKMLSGGEALSRDLADSLLRTGGTLWNGYGPTETTIYSSLVKVKESSGPVTIGPPMANTRFYVVDEAGHLRPPGFAGELCIGGSGVAAGYFERPDLNAERFIPDRWAVGDGEGPINQETLNKQPRLFRTGDLVRWLPERQNAFEIFGRLDQQVKLRGYRIELGEIETVLRSESGIADAAVLLREDEPGEPWLVGYCTQKSGTAVNITLVRENAARRLPAYMLPSRLVMLESLPLTGSGKVDRRALAALPAPIEGAAEGNIAAEPANDVEASLLRIFREVMKSKTFGVEDNFFRYGGYSMQAIRLLAMINHSLQQQLPLTVLFDAPTVRKLAALIRGGDVLEALVPIRQDGEKAPFFLVQSYLLYDLSRNVVEDGRPIYGLREQGWSRSFPGLQEQVTAYVAAINKQWPRGPVHLGGWCAAAPLTVEIARSLSATGRRVGMVALFDAEAPGFVERPLRGSLWLASIGAMWRFHRMRLRDMSWRARFSYVQERLAMAPQNLIGRFYERYMGKMVRLQKRLPWLPGSLFRNRFNAGDVVDVAQLQPLDLRVQLFRARDVPSIPGSDDALGWRTIARGGVEVKFIPGHHESMFLAPNIDALRSEFQASMRQVETEAAINR